MLMLSGPPCSRRRHRCPSRKRNTLQPPVYSVPLSPLGDIQNRREKIYIKIYKSKVDPGIEPCQSPEDVTSSSGHIPKWEDNVDMGIAFSGVSPREVEGGKNYSNPRIHGLLRSWKRRLSAHHHRTQQTNYSDVLHRDSHPARHYNPHSSSSTYASPVLIYRIT